MGEYKFAGIVDENKVFVINHSEITERIDPIYFKSVNDLLLVKDTTNPVFKLSEVVNMKRGRFGHRPRNDPKFYNGKYPFIQTGDIVKASKTGGQIPYSQTLNELGLKTSRLFEEKAIIITIAANIGDTAILDYPACFPDSLIAMTPKEEDKLQLEYLNVYFKFLKKYLNDLAPQAAQKNINYQQLAPTPIVVPPIEMQQKIITLYKKAYASKQQKEKEAKDLLTSIDTYLFNKLGITLLIKEGVLKTKTFTINFSEISNGRMDSTYYKKEFQELEKSFSNSKFDIFTFKNIIHSITNGFDFRDYKKSGTPYLKVANIKKGNFDFSNIQYIDFDSEEISKKIQLKKNNLLLTRKGTFGNALSLDDDYNYVISSEVFYIDLKDKIVNSKYLELFFNSSIGQIQFDRFSIGAIMGSLSQEAVNSLKVILPPIEKQNEIAKHISSVELKVKQLKKEAKNTLEIAKQDIERLILGNQ